MSIDEFKHIICEIKPYTKFVYLHLMGEPLLHPKLDEFIKICKENNINVNITTNGSLLLKNKDIFIYNPVRQINISLHSIEKEDKDFYNYVDNIIKSVNEINLKTKTYISLRLWNVENENNSRQKYILNKLSENFNKNVDSLDLKNFRTYTIKENLFLSMDKKFVWPSLSNNIYSLVGTCKGLKAMCGILVDGTVVPCCLDASGDENLGNIFKQPFKEIIESEKVNNIIENFNNNKIICSLCQRCSYRNRFEK